MNGVESDRIVSTAPAARQGVGASTLTLVAGPWATVLEALVARFPAIAEAEWRSRFDRGLVQDDAGTPVAANHPATPGLRLHYWRELPPEPAIPFTATILHRDAHLLAVDKPHFLPVLPAGRYVQETLLVRLRRELGLDDIAPLHRLDRDTAGVMLFSLDPSTRAAYHALFAQRRVHKVYEALAAADTAHVFPLVRRSRLVPGEPFFRMVEAEGAPNSETRIEYLERVGALARYRLEPVSGRKHQLRVHMAALGLPLLNDPLYPTLQAERAPTDFSRPLALLARSIAFDDPLTGTRRCFSSRRELAATETTPG